MLIAHEYSAQYNMPTGVHAGEVVNRKEAHRRALAYQAARQRHTYIMTLRWADTGCASDCSWL